jgi:hypothetical protein
MTSAEISIPQHIEHRSFVRFDDVDGRWITTDAAALITYMATARWNYESSASKTLCASVYVREGGSWRVAFHQQTPI